MTKILITGAAGFIGYHASINFLKKGFRVIGIDSINDYYDVNLKYKRLEILNEEALLNFRLQWIPIIGADFFFIVNQAYDTSGNSWTLERTTVLGKLIWRFVI